MWGKTGVESRLRRAWHFYVSIRIAAEGGCDKMRVMMFRAACVLMVLLVNTWVYGLPEGFDVALGKKDLAAAKEQTLGELESLKPAKGKAPPRFQENILWGNLFKDGRIFALVPLHDLTATTAYAEWRKGHWEFRNAWKLDEGWAPWTSDTEKPFSELFKLKDLNGDGVPELLARYDQQKYGSNCAIAIYSKAKGTLTWLDAFCFMIEPEVRGDYLVTFDASRRKAWWRQESFYRWKGNTLEWMASWGEDTMEANISSKVENGTARIYYKAALPGAKPGTKKEFVWDGLEVKCDDRRVGTIDLTSHLPKSEEPNNLESECADAETLWVFVAMTGLPWKVAGGNATSDKSPAELKKLWKYLTVEVTGDPALVKRLTPAVKELNKEHGK
jgi:hypothetical protein